MGKEFEEPGFEVRIGFRRGRYLTPPTLLLCLGALAEPLKRVGRWGKQGGTAAEGVPMNAANEYRAKVWEYLSLAENRNDPRATRRYAPVRENVDEPFGTDG